MDPAPAIDLRSYGAERRQHRHDHHQFVLPLAGALELETPAGARRADGATGVLIAAGETHAFRGRGANRFAVIDVAASADAPLFERARREPAFALPEGLRHHLALLEARAAGGPLPGPFRHHWTALLIEGLQAAASRPSPSSPSPPSTGPSARFAAARRYVERHCHRPLPVAELADQVHLSVAGLTALFQRHAGFSPRDWIAAVRLDRAARLLAASDRTIADIALACGFSEHSALSRAFRRDRGISPSAYRARARGTWMCRHLGRR